MRDGPDGPPRLGSIVRGLDQLCEEVWDTSETVEVHAPPSERGRRASLSEPVAQRARRQVRRMEHIDEAKRLAARGGGHLLTPSPYGRRSGRPFGPRQP